MSALRYNRGIRSYPPAEMYRPEGAMFPIYVFGTAGAECSEEIDSRIAGITKSNNTQLVWISGTKNNQCWLAAIDTSSIPISGSTGGALITSRHLLGVGHAAPSVGDMFAWIDSLGKTQITRTITSVITANSFDLSVATLDSALSSAVSTMQILDPNWKSPFPSSGSYIPAAWVSRTTSGVNVQDVFLFPTLQTPEAGAMRYFVGGSGFSATRQNWYAIPVSGDSGSPCFLLMRGKPVLVSLIASTNGDGPFVPQAIPWINSVTQADGYSVSIRTPVEFYQYA